MKQTVKFRVESSIELVPDTDTPIEAVGFAILSEETFGEDADGRRGGIRTEVDEIEFVRLWAWFPDRPEVLLADTPAKVDKFLTNNEMDRLVDEACLKVFLSGDYEEWEPDL